MKKYKYLGFVVAVLAIVCQVNAQANAQEKDRTKATIVEKAIGCRTEELLMDWLRFDRNGDDDSRAAYVLSGKCKLLRVGQRATVKHRTFGGAVQLIVAGDEIWTYAEAIGE